MTVCYRTNSRHFSTIKIFALFIFASFYLGVGLAHATNVKAFGAVANGQHDDSAAFRRAIATAMKGDRVLYIPIGNYLVGDIELPANNFRIYGEGAFTKGGSRLVLKKGGKSIFYYHGATQCHSLTFESLIFDGASQGVGISLFGDGEVKPKNSPFNISVSNVRFVNCTYGFLAAEIFASEWRRITIDGCSRGGIIGLTGPSNVLQSIIIQSIPVGAVGIHVYSNNAHIIGLTAARGHGTSLVVGRGAIPDGRNGVAWVRLVSSHFEDFTTIPVEVRGGSRLTMEDVEFFAPEKNAPPAFVRITYGMRMFWMNNVRFHSKGGTVKDDIIVDNATKVFKVLEVGGIRLRETRLRIGKKSARVQKLMWSN